MLSCFAIPLCFTYIPTLVAYFSLSFSFLFPFCLVYLLLGCDIATVVLKSLFESILVAGYDKNITQVIKNIDNLLCLCLIKVYEPLSVVMWCGTLKHQVIRQDCPTCHPCRFSSRAFPLFHSGWDGDHVCLSAVYL